MAKTRLKVDEASKESQMKEGLFTTGNAKDFEDVQEIRRNMIDRGELPHCDTPLPKKKTYEELSGRYIKRQEMLKETEAISNNVEFTFSKSICLNFIGDLHIGALDVDYKRIEEEMHHILETPNSYVMMMGDLIEGFFFNPAQMEQIEQVPDQYKLMRSLLEYYSKAGRLLIGWTGDHDTWSKSRGVGAYSDFSEFTGAHLMSGTGYATLNVGEQQYKVTGSHRFPGNSMYNKNHAGKRSVVFGASGGSDIVVSAHTHGKGYTRDSMTRFGGVAEPVHILNIGPYKWVDGYARKLGLTPIANGTSQMYGSAVILNSETKDIHYYDDILQANKILTERY